ncbi:MAG: arginase [Phycisphaeraceae bacterium]|nr:MAG: arginase [Phycisphaeraceae bacterium]
MRVPHCQPGVWPEGIPSGRFAAGVRTDDPAGCTVALIGMPDDTGVRLNNGRPGAAEGPGAFRAALAAYGAREPAGIAWPGVFDAGDVTPSGDDLHATHARVTEAVGAALDAGLFPVGIGGGHDLTFPFVRAVAGRADEAMVGVYFDAHLDVRDADGSGMPFRRLIEGGHARELHVHGLDRFANSREHVEWFLANGGRVGDFGRKMEWPEGDLFVSLDLDVLDQAHAPGVSAMNPNGWSPMLCEQWCRAAGLCERVRCFDVMELSPPHDDRGRTARLAAHMFLAFLSGFAEREK